MNVLEELRTPSVSATLRRSSLGDVPAIVALLADDRLAGARDGVDGARTLEPYARAFDAINADPAHLLVVAEVGSRVMATLQLSFFPGMARGGAWRAQIEAVRVHADLRGSGLGSAMVTWSIEEARRRGCVLVQLTSDKRRPEAHRFYARLGFVASHEGFKLDL